MEGLTDTTIFAVLGGKILIKHNDKYNLITFEGKLLSGDGWLRVGNFRKGFAMVKNIEGKYNHLGRDGELLSDTWWDWVDGFFDTVALVKNEGKYNYIGMDGKLISDTWWDNAFAFDNKEYAVVYNGGKWGKIDLGGNLIMESVDEIPTTFDSACRKLFGK